MKWFPVKVNLLSPTMNGLIQNLFRLPSIQIVENILNVAHILRQCSTVPVYLWAMLHVYIIMDILMWQLGLAVNNVRLHVHGGSWIDLQSAWPWLLVINGTCWGHMFVGLRPIILHKIAPKEWKILKDWPTDQKSSSQKIKMPNWTVLI